MAGHVRSLQFELVWLVFILSCCSKVPIRKLNNMHFECTTIIIIVFEVHAKLKWFEFSESNKTHWWFRDVFLCVWDWIPCACRLAFIIRYFLFTEWNYVAVTHGLDVLITSVQFFDETMLCYLLSICVPKQQMLDRFNGILKIKSKLSISG